MNDNEYKIKYESIEEFRRMASGNIARWEEQLSEIEGCLKRLLNMETFQGESADAIRAYIQEVHITLLSAIRQCLREYSTRLLMYQSEYYKIDSDKDACLPEKEISDIGKHLQKQEEFLLEKDKSIRSILDEISDILPLPVPSQEKLLSDIGEVIKKSNKLNVDVRSYESEKAKEVMEEFAPLTESIKKAIQKYTGQERQLYGYASGDADKVQEIAELNKKVMQSNWYMIENGADIQVALKEKGEQVEENQPVWYSQKYNAEEPDMHLILDLAGMLPAAGAVFDGINATWYLAEGDYTNAALSGMALIPVIGEFAGVGKVGIKGAKCADDIADAVKALDNTKDVAKAVDDMAGTAKYLDDVIESGSKTGTVWDNITPTQENYAFTNIPKSFEVEVNGEKMWVHGNATEHMYEDVYKGITTGNGTAYTNPNLYTQEIMSDFYGSLQEATESGIVYGEKITQGNWEFIFAQPRQAGQLPVIKHAQFNGWH